MGEYYKWVNVDKKEYIDPTDFDYGCKSHESTWRDNTLLMALRELLSHEWKDCRIIWLGDECGIPENIAPELFSLFRKHTEEYGYPGDVLDTVCEFYRDVSGKFKAAEKDVREELEYFLDCVNAGIPCVNEYGVDPSNPYEGLFQREGRSFRYTINITKNVCYCFNKTKILFKDGTENNFSDPLPILLGYGRVMEAGPWLGDVISVADEIDDSIYVLPSITLDW